MGFSHLLLAAALLGLANCLTCKYCDSSVEGKKCSENHSEDRVCPEGKKTSCTSKFPNNRDLSYSDCSGDEAPAKATECDELKCVNMGRDNINCYCTTENCNDEKVLEDCEPKAEPTPEPENGAEGKVGAVVSVLVASIFAAFF